MDTKNNCIYRLYIGIFVRLFTTVFLIYYIGRYYKKSPYLLLILVGKLLFTDALDSIFTLFYKGNLKDCWSPCTGLHYYQSADKILDLISYILVYLMLDCNQMVGLFIVWRFVGVILFNASKKRVWLVPFFDFIKEYLLYLYFIGKNNTFLPIFIIMKIIFEYYFHIYRQSKSRCLKFKMDD